MSTGSLMAPGAPPVVLASGSDVRAALLRAAGLDVQVVRPAVDEAAVRDALRAEGVATADTAVALAELKAVRGSALAADDALVIGADQMLELDGAWLEKPVDRTAARAQLLQLRGRRHRLVSAAVVCRGGSRIWHGVDAAELDVRPFSDDWLDAYLDVEGEAATASVGAYRLEGPGAQLMARVRGDHFTVLGLPLLPLLQHLRDQRVLLA